MNPLEDDDGNVVDHGLRAVQLVRRGGDAGAPDDAQEPQHRQAMHATLWVLRPYSKAVWIRKFASGQLAVEAIGIARVSEGLPWYMWNYRETSRILGYLRRITLKTGAKVRAL